jgi:GNAT superfamily N-acetyltransferase
MSIAVIAVTHAHIATLVDVLMDAFATDPFYVRAFAGPHYDAMLRQHFAHAVEDGIATGLTFTRESLDSVALWTHSESPAPPERTKPAAYRAIVTQLDRFAPPPPTLYLHILATASTARGQGAGSALTRHMFGWVDALGWPIYLETQNESNVGFYQALGFRVTQKIDVIDGLPLWGMLRECQK